MSKSRMSEASLNSDAIHLCMQCMVRECYAFLFFDHESCGFVAR